MKGTTSAKQIKEGEAIHPLQFKKEIIHEIVLQSIEVLLVLIRNLKGVLLWH